MAYDPEQHDFDPKTGLLIDKETGHIIGLHAKPEAPVAEGIEYPKWVAPHESHIVRTQREKDGPFHISTPAFVQSHVHRVTNEVTVLVKDAEEEALALAEFIVPTEPESPKPKLVSKK